MLPVGDLAQAEQLESTSVRSTEDERRALWSSERGTEDNKARIVVWGNKVFRVHLGLAEKLKLLLDDKGPSSIKY